MTAVEFGAILATAGTGALAFVAAGVTAGGAILAVFLGIKGGIKGLRTVAK